MVRSPSTLDFHGGSRLLLAVFLSLNFGWLTPASANDYLVQSWHVEDGLPDNTITALAQTPDGFLWVGTFRGLVRFDGIRFAHVGGTPDTGNGDDLIEGLMVDRKGALWIESGSGQIARFANLEFRILYVPPPLPGGPQKFIIRPRRWSSFSPLALDADGNVWAVQANDTLLRFANDGPNKPPATISLTSLPEGRLQGCWSDAAGQIWILKGTQVCAFLNGRWHCLSSGGKPSLDRGVACAGRDGGLYISLANSAGGENNLTRFTMERGADLTLPGPGETEAPRTTISAVLEDRAGRLWASTWWDGLYIRGPKGQWQHVQTKGNLAKCVVTSLFEDRQGSIWVGTLDQGLHQVVPQIVSAVLLPPEASEDHVTALCAAKDGAVWMGTDENGLYRWKAGRYSHFGVAEGLPSPRIASVSEDAHGHLWAGTFGGLAKFEETRFVAAPGPPAVVHALFNDRSGNLWCGGQSGLQRLSNQTNWFQFRPPDAGNFDILYIAQDRDGQIWMVDSARGLMRMEGDQIRPAELQAQLGSDNPRSIFCDTDGVTWIGTFFGGLFRWNGTRLQHYSVADGLPDDQILSLTADDDDNLWISSNNGLFGCSRSSLAAYSPGQSPSLLCWRLELRDGLPNLGCSGAGQPVASRATDGRIWVANMVGAAAFDPRAVTSKRINPNLIIEGVTADGVELLPGASGFHATSTTRRFEFHYTAPDLSAARTLRFYYRLDGVDRDWVNAGPARAAAYSRLPPGQYIFRVKFGGRDGQWHESNDTLLLHVVPRFWELRWVQALAAVTLVAGLIAVITTIARSRLKRKVERLYMQQALENERSRIAQDLHDDLGSGLTEIMLLTDEARQPGMTTNSVRVQLDTISGKTQLLAQAMDEIVWTVNPRNDSLPSLAGYLCEHAQEFFRPSEIHCRLDVAENLPPVPVPAKVRHNLFLAVKEAFHNVAKHSGATEVWLHIHCDPNELRIAIEDNGHSFDPQRLRRGDGLLNMRDRLQTVGGTTLIATRPAGGTCVLFKLNLKDMSAEPATGPLPPYYSNE